jgi:hypothetical protein
VLIVVLDPLDELDDGDVEELVEQVGGMSVDYRYVLSNL